MSIKIEGLEDLTRSLTLLNEESLKSIEKAVWKKDQQIMNESMEHCPVHPGSGELRRSGKVMDPVVTKNRITQEMGYYTNYALYVHEMLDPTASGRAVQWSLAGTGNKFLENAFMAHADEIPDVIAEAVNEAIERQAK